MRAAVLTGVLPQRIRRGGARRVTRLLVTVAAKNFKILKLVSPQDGLLSSSDYLAEYEAIVIKPEWARLVMMSAPDMDSIVRSEADFGRKSGELGDFLRSGGLLVVLVVPTENQLLQSAYSNPHNNLVWWGDHLTVPYTGQTDLIERGSGTSVEPTGSGSEFDEYLEAVQRYGARLGSWFEDEPNVQILARNRAGGPVAAEITVGNGTVVCLPPPSNEVEQTLLFKGVDAFLGHRFGPGLKWPVKDEEGLGRAREKLITDFHTGMAAVSNQQEAVQQRKRAVFAKSQVSRAVGYFDQATRPGSSPRQIMTALYSLIEMLKDYYDAEWKGLADLLGVSYKSVERIKTLANKPEKHMRHVNASDPEGVDQAELDRVIDDAKAIMSSFITREYATEATKPKPA
jgi:hypothetical protein